ncbi:TPA: hypothetical protein ACH3X1_015657 [Trebouxia sp. C0004]
MRGSQQNATPARRHAPSRLSCLLDCNQDQARPAEVHTHSAAHRDSHCAWCATRCIQYAGRASLTILGVQDPKKLVLRSSFLLEGNLNTLKEKAAAVFAQRCCCHSSSSSLCP